VLEHDHKPRAAPKLNIVPIDKALCLFDCLGAVHARQRLESVKMPIVPDDVSPVVDHSEVPCRMRDSITPGVEIGLSGSGLKIKLGHGVFKSGHCDRLEAATDQAIAACGGDARDAVKALIVANEFLEAQVRSGIGRLWIFASRRH
jgi:hypothetical protein